MKKILPINTLQVFLFGKFNVCCNGTSLTTFGIQRVQELLCYLLIHRQSPHNRGLLTNLLWEGLSSEQSKSYFRKALWQLQSALDKSVSRSDLLVVEDDWLQVNTTANVWIDLAEFEDMYYKVQEIPGRNLDSEQAKSMANAIILYQGDLLQGWYQDWCLTERERLQHQYLVMLDKLVEYCIVHGAYEKGVVYGGQILRCDIARECTHRQLMTLHALSGDRTSAVRQYERCIAILDKELGVKPAADTVELYKQICGDGHTATGPALLPNSKPYNDLLVQLQEVSQLLTTAKTTLDELQIELKQQANATNSAIQSHT